MKKHKKCILIALGIIVGWYLTVDITRAVQGENLIFFERWFFSDKEYAKNIEIKSYILNREQILTLLKDPEKKIDQPCNRELYKQNVYLVVGLKNNREAFCWGTLIWKKGGANWSKIDIWDVPPLHVSKNFSYYFIPLGNAVFLNNNELPLEIKIKWKSFYTYY